MDLSSLKRMSFKHKNNKPLFYLKGYIRLIIPNWSYRRNLKKELSKIDNYDAESICKRVDYYNKLDGNYTMPEGVDCLSDFRIGKKLKIYFFDTYRYTRYFNTKLSIHLLFGDIVYVPDKPSIVKSRPIGNDNANSVILKLGSVRHFLFVKDKNLFEKKKDMLVFRGKVNQPHRARFMDMYYGHPLCNIGQVKRSKNQKWLDPSYKKQIPDDKWKVARMTISEQLKYKFILCLEGNDVASNLKWVMSSNSIAVMPKSKYETWFMEGTLIPNHHYIAIKDDYSDLEERLNHYIQHPDEAKKIIQNAHEYIKPFKNKKTEKLISLLVLQKYFEKTGQL